MAFIGRMIENYMKTPLPGTFGYMREETRQAIKKELAASKETFPTAPLRQPPKKDECSLHNPQRPPIRSTPEQIRDYKKLVMRVAKDYEQTLGHLQQLLLKAHPFLEKVEQFYSHQQAHPLSFDVTNPELFQQQLAEIQTNHAIAEGFAALKIRLNKFATRLTTLNKAQDVFSNKFISRAERATKANAFLSELEPPLSGLGHQ